MFNKHAHQGTQFLHVLDAFETEQRVSKVLSFLGKELGVDMSAYDSVKDSVLAIVKIEMLEKMNWCAQPMEIMLRACKSVADSLTALMVHFFEYVARTLSGHFHEHDLTELTAIINAFMYVAVRLKAKTVQIQEHAKAYMLQGLISAAISALVLHVLSLVIRFTLSCFRRPTFNQPFSNTRAHSKT